MTLHIAIKWVLKTQGIKLFTKLRRLKIENKSKLEDKQMSETKGSQSDGKAKNLAALVREKINEEAAQRKNKNAT